MAFPWEGWKRVIDRDHFGFGYGAVRGGFQHSLVDAGHRLNGPGGTFVGLVNAGSLACRGYGGLHKPSVDDGPLAGLFGTPSQRWIQCVARRCGMNFAGSTRDRRFSPDSRRLIKANSIAVPVRT